MANVKITALTGISSADVDNEDVFVVVDLSADETKKITLANVIAAVDTDTNEVSNVVALQGGLEGANSNQVAIATFADDTGTWQAGNLIPKANGVYSLGAADALWKDVFISAGSIKLGGVTISAADDEGITIAGASGDTTAIVTPTAGGAANVSANIALLESNVSILLGSTAGQNTRIASEEANVINLQTGLVGANVALTNEIAATNVDVTNLVTGIGGSNSRIAAEEANVIALQSGISGSNSRIFAEEANVIALQAGLTGANTNISSNDTDITNLVTGLGGSNTAITALEARRAANTLIFDGAFTGSNTRISAEEANVIALQGGIAGANTAISGNDTDITNLITGLDGSNVTIATKAATTYVDSQIAAIVDSAPETLNTLNELAAALGDDANFATTTATQIGTISSNTVNLQTGITGSNTNITANEARRAANTSIFLGAFTGSNARISAEEANVIALQGGIAGANTAISNEIAATNTDITNLVTGLDGSNTNVTALEARRAANTSIFLGAFTGSNTRLAAEEANVIALQGGIDGANTAISNEIAATNNDITNLVTGLDGSNTTIATKDSVANVYATYLVAKGGIDGANTNIASNDTDITNLVTGLDGSNTTIATKDSVANVYATYLVAKGGIDGANTNITSNDTDITNLVTGLQGANTNISSNDTDITNLVTGLGGANTNITAVEARRTANIAGAVSSITTSDLTASRALTSDVSGKVAVSAVTSTELGYLDGVTSAIQTQLDAKLEGNQTITLSGDVSGSGTTSITVTVADDSHNHVISNIDNLQTSLDEKDTVANVYATYLVAKGGIDGANSAISSNDTDITNLVTGLGGSNTNITALEARRAANTAILLGAHSGANTRIAAEEANVIALQGGIAGANTAIGLRATTASPTFTGVPAAPTAAAGTSTTQIATTAFVGTAVANIVDSAPEALNTLNELAAALGDDANFSTTVSTQIGTISSNTVTNATNITAVEARRVANIAGAVSSITTGDLTASRALVSDGSGKVAVSAVTSTELGYLDGVTSAIQAQLDGKQASGSYLTGNQTITLSGDVSGSGTTAITVTVADDSHNHVISNIDNLQTTLDSKDTVANVYATYLVAKGGIDGANTNITAVEARRTANIAGAVSSITTGDLTASRALVSDGSGKVAVSAVTSTELGYLDGVSSAIQTQLDAKLATASYTAADVLTKIKTVDGAGSGLDADLLDGQSSAYYAVEATRSSNAAQLAAGIASAGGTMTAAEIRALGFFDTSNDGAGSGLDTDLLDGVQGSSYLRSDASDTYTGQLDITSGQNIRFGHANQSDGNDGKIGAGLFTSGLNIVGTQTVAAAGRRISIYGTMYDGSSSNKYWHAGIDGAGSGLDADLLDGIDSGSFLRSDAADVATSLIRFGGNLSLGSDDDVYLYESSAGAFSVRSGSSGAYHYLTFSAAGVLDVGGSTFWHSGNDGSGSGLDADTLDGQQGSYYAPTASPTFTGTATYYVLQGPAANTRDKIRVWNSSLYSIGMGSGYTFGELNDYAMSFQMNSVDNRGFWWGDSVHTNAQGAMSLTTIGELTVAKSISISGSETATSGTTGLYMFDDGNPHVHGDNNLWINSTSGNLYLNNQNSGNIIMTNGTGKVGIGTSSPSSLLHLRATGPAILTLEADTDNVTESDNARIELSQDGGAVTGHMGYGTNANGIDIWNDHGDYVRFGTANAERMRIDSSGNVGIGTTAPTALLNVKEGTNADSTGQPSGNFAAIVHHATNSSTSHGLLVKNNWAAAASTVLEVGLDIVGGAYRQYHKIDGSGQAIWSPGGTERMRLDFSGNLSVGGKLQENGSNLIPAGFIGMWGAAAAPSGWYLCEGGAISRTTYAALFAAIGTTYGVGNGSTTFNVPDFRDRAPYGASTYTLGSKTTNEINGSAQAATSSGGSTTHTVTTSTTNSTTDKDVTNSITVVTGVSAHAAHSHTVTYPATAVKFIIKT